MRTDVLSKLLPELAMVLAALAVALMPERVPTSVRESMEFVVLVEVLFCMAQATLTDIATRIKKPPPLWLGLLILGGLALFNPDVVSVVVGMFRQGWAIFLPFGWSLVERGRELWTMPRASQLEKLRRRALVSGRISLVLVFGGAAVATLCVSYLLDNGRGGAPLLERTAFWWLAAAFSLTAYDVVRVHRPAFERHPRALFGRFDPLGVTDLAPV